jgi:hypothetical protein
MLTDGLREWAVGVREGDIPPGREEGMELPVILWEEGMVIPEPEGHVPNYIDLGGGLTVDEYRLPWILDALLKEHPEAERIREIYAERPGLNLEPEDAEHMIMVRLAATGEPVGLFDSRLLRA